MTLPLSPLLGTLAVERLLPPILSATFPLLRHVERLLIAFLVVAAPALMVALLHLFSAWTGRYDLSSWTGLPPMLAHAVAIAVVAFIPAGLLVVFSCEALPKAVGKRLRAAAQRTADDLGTILLIDQDGLSAMSSHGRIALARHLAEADPILRHAAPIVRAARLPAFHVVPSR